jgi:hypothetical protein
MLTVIFLCLNQHSVLNAARMIEFYLFIFGITYPVLVFHSLYTFNFTTKLGSIFQMTM